MKKGGFTLLETVVSAFILAFTLLGLYVIFEKGYFIWERGNEDLERYQEAKGCFDLMSRELRSSFLSLSNSNLIFKGEENKIVFYSSSNIAHEEKEYDLKKVEYKLQDGTIFRKVISVLEDKNNPGATTVLVSRVVNLSFSYYDGRKWRKSWDSEKKKITDSLPLPEAVRLRLILKRENDKPLVFSTMVNLPVK